MPLRDLKGYMWDICEAGREAMAFLQGIAFHDFVENPLLPAAVERKLEIVGEALSQAIKHFPEIQPLFPEAPQVIAMRNLPTPA